MPDNRTAFSHNLKGQPGVAYHVLFFVRAVDKDEIKFRLPQKLGRSFRERLQAKLNCWPAVGDFPVGRRPGDNVVADHHRIRTIQVKSQGSPRPIGADLKDSLGVTGLGKMEEKKKICQGRVFASIKRMAGRKNHRACGAGKILGSDRGEREFAPLEHLLVKGDPQRIVLPFLFESSRPGTDAWQPKRPFFAKLKEARKNAGAWGGFFQKSFLFQVEYER